MRLSDKNLPLERLLLLSKRYETLGHLTNCLLGLRLVRRKVKTFQMNPDFTSRQSKWKAESEKETEKHGGGMNSAPCLHGFRVPVVQTGPERAGDEEKLDVHGRFMRGAFQRLLPGGCCPTRGFSAPEVPADQPGSASTGKTAAWRPSSGPAGYLDCLRQVFSRNDPD